MPVFLPPRCEDCGAKPGERHLSWCPCGPARIRLSRAKGWRKPEGAIVVARPTLWGNPWKVGEHGTRAQCVARYAILAMGYISVGGKVPVKEQERALLKMRADLDQLKGRDLACWCSHDGPCHADVLLELANAEHPALGRFREDLPPTIWVNFDEMQETAAQTGGAKRI